MRKIMVALLCFMSMEAVSAHAEHKLFITDVLSAGQFEVEADLSYAHNNGDTARKLQAADPITGLLLDSYIDAPGTQTRNIVSSLYSIGAGVGYGLQLNAAIPYAHVDNTKLQDSSRLMIPAYYRKQDGVGDLVVGVKYSLYENRARSISVVTGLDVKFYTADSDKAGTGTNDIAPFIAASTVINGNLKPYASYRAVFRDHGAADAHVLSTGLDYEVNKKLTLAPKFSATFRTDSDWATAYNSYAFGLSSYVNIFSNLYLIPNFTTGISTSSNTKNHYMDYGTLRFYSAGVGLYYLFN